MLFYKAIVQYKHIPIGELLSNFNWYLKLDSVLTVSGKRSFDICKLKDLLPQPDKLWHRSLQNLTFWVKITIEKLWHIIFARILLHYSSYHRWTVQIIEDGPLDPLWNPGPRRLSSPFAPAVVPLLSTYFSTRVTHSYNYNSTFKYNFENTLWPKITRYNYTNKIEFNERIKQFVFLLNVNAETSIK